LSAGWRTEALTTTPVVIVGVSGRSKAAGDAVPMTDNLDIIRAPSALTTGGSGFAFEDVVGAFIVSGLLAGASPVGKLGPPRLVGFQGKALGHVLDDLAVLGADGVARWYASVKSFDLVRAGRLEAGFVSEAWQQLLSSGFDIERDYVGFACAGTAEGNWRGLLSLVETARTDIPERLASRIGVSGVFDEVQRRLWESARCPAELQARLSIAADAAPGLLLSRLIPLRLERVGSGSLSIPQAKAWCEQALSTGHAARAPELWDAILALVSRVRPRGGAIEWGLISRELGGRYPLAQRPDAGPDWVICNRHTHERVTAVRGTLAGGVSLPRVEAHSALADVGDAPFIYLSGDSGSGKTVLAKSWLQAGRGDRLWLSATDLSGGLSGFTAQYGLRFSLSEVLALGQLPIRVVVDGLDRISATGSAAAVAALARTAAGSAGAMQLLVTCQSFALERVIRAVLSADGPSYRTVAIGELDDGDLRLALQQRPALRRLASTGRLDGVLRRAKMLEVLADAMATTPEQALQTVGDEAAVADLWWNGLALGAEQRAQRSEFLIGLATRQGDELVDGIQAGQLGALGQFAQTADALRADSILAVDESTYAFAHDLFGDWSRLRALGDWEHTAAQTIPQKAPLPSWQRAIRLFALRSLKTDRDAWSAQHAGLRDAGHDLAADLFLEAPLLTLDAEQRLEGMWSGLVGEERPLLSRLLTRFLYVASVPDPTTALFASEERPELQTYFETTWRVPIWVLWPPVIRVLAAHVQEALQAAPLQVAEIVDRWLRAPHAELPARDAAARLGLAIGQLGEADFADHRYRERDERIKLWRAFLAAGREMPEEVSALALRVLSNDEEEDETW
jgi:hypothetical protein